MCPDRSADYRERAQQLRSLADKTDNKNVQKDILALADDYERWAERTACPQQK